MYIGHVACTQKTRNQDFNKKPEEKVMSLERRKCILEDNNKIYIRITGCDNVNWISMSKDEFQRRTFLNKKTKRPSAYQGQCFLEL
jgi:hypothetical protein